MNGYAIIILATLVIGYLLELITERLNLKALHPELPPEFRDVYDPERYARSQAYTREKTRFGLIHATFGLAVTLGFWFGGGFAWLDRLVRSWEWGGIATGLAFIGLLLLARMILDLPFRIYSVFGIEERYGFNKTTPGTFVLDLLKGLLLAVVLGGALLAGIIAFFENAGPLAWLWCWVATALFALIMQFLAPTYLMPLFNKFTPLEDGELRAAIMRYARAVDSPLDNLFVMDGSKRSTKSNAFFTGFGRHKRIALFDTLIENHTISELVAILAHEIGHYKKRHILQGLVISIVHTGVMFYLLSIFLSHEGLFEAFYVETPSVYAGLIFFGMLFAPIDMMLSVAMQVFSRKNEYEADRFAAETTGDGESMVSALKKLSADNLSNLTPHPLYVMLNYSHPPVLERIRAIRGG